MKDNKKYQQLECSPAKQDSPRQRQIFNFSGMQAIAHLLAIALFLLTGWSFFLQEGKPTFAYNFLNRDRTLIQSAEKIPTGASKLRFEFESEGGKPGAGGVGKLFINDVQVAESRIPQTVPYRLGLDETFDVGRDTGTPVVETYQVPFAFTGNLQQVTLDLKA